MTVAGRMLRHARRSKGWTQRELARASGIPQETIARIERGRIDPRVGTLDRLLEACSWGLELEPRLGIGIDRTVIRRLIAMPDEERLQLALASDQRYEEFRRAFRKVAE